MKRDSGVAESRFIPEREKGETYCMDFLLLDIGI
jgi:hypothetical protein